MSLPEMFVSWHGSQMGDDQRTEEGPVPTLLQEETREGIYNRDCASSSNQT